MQNQNQIERTLDSREVATMIGKQHKNLLADIRGYVSELDELKIQPVDFFKVTSYRDTKGQERPQYNITKKGCEFIAHKLTGIKGTEFTARYINRFHDMEEKLKEGNVQKTKQSKSDRTEIMMMNARSRMAQTYLRLAQVTTLSDTYKTVLVAKASEVLAGEEVIPLPKVEKKTYSAKELGDKFGVTANKIGRIANTNNLKVPEYGEYRRDKSKYSAKEVDTWVYFETAIPVLAKLLGTEVA